MEVLRGNESYPGVSKGVAIKRGRIGSCKALTVVELLIVIIIVVILAAIAVPWYTGYVERKRVTEVMRNMGAIITSQRVEKARTGKYYSASTVAEFKSRGIDITDTKFFTYETVTKPNGGFMVAATPTDSFGASGEPITFIKNPGERGRWGTDEEPILKDYLLLQT